MSLKNFDKSDQDDKFKLQKTESKELRGALFLPMYLSGIIETLKSEFQESCFIPKMNKGGKFIFRILIQVGWNIIWILQSNGRISHTDEGKVYLFAGNIRLLQWLPRSHPGRPLQIE